MWTSRDISLDIEMADGNDVIVVLATPAGILKIAGECGIGSAFFV